VQQKLDLTVPQLLHRQLQSVEVIVTIGDHPDQHGF